MFMNLNRVFLELGLYICYSTLKPPVLMEDMMTEQIEELLAKGIALQEAGELKLAETEFRRCVELEPENPEGHFNLGYILTELGSLDEAQKIFENGLKLAPDDVEALTALGDIYFEKGNCKEAINVYKKVTELNPSDPDGFVS